MSQSNVRVSISAERDIMRAVLDASRVAKSQNFSTNEISKITTAVSELARNIIKYAETGEVWIRPVERNNGLGIEIVVRDSGPGIPDLQKALSDHYSTGGTLGLGIPGVRRLMDEFEIDSTPGTGTTVTIRQWGSDVRPKLNPLLMKTASLSEDRLRPRGWGGSLPDQKEAQNIECAFFMRPALGEKVSGDGVLLERRGDFVFLAVVDGLGHGRSAHEVATRSVRHLRGNWPADPSQAMHDLDKFLTGSIGAAVGLALLKLSTRELRFVGVGNVVARTMGSRGARIVSVEGTVGTALRTLKEQKVTMREGELILFHTDGVGSGYERDEYPQMLYEPAKQVAQTIVERFGKSYDDATCLAVRFLA
jgi:anti-sigma regulatory factor (Ser/Thr protein kinase)